MSEEIDFLDELEENPVEKVQKDQDDKNNQNHQDNSNESNAKLLKDLWLPDEDYPVAFLNLAKMVQEQFSNLPKMNYDEIYDEISDLSVNAAPTPTLEVLNDELYKVQGCKDRLSEILIQVTKSYNIKKRLVDILKEAWGKYTAEKNAEGRRGDAAMRLSFYVADLAAIDGLYKSCMHTLKNLDSLNDNLSRRITIWQLMIKLGDIGRGSNAPADYDRSSDFSQESSETDEELFGEDEVLNEKQEDSKDAEIKLRSF